MKTSSIYDSLQRVYSLLEVLEKKNNASLLRASHIQNRIREAQKKTDDMYKSIKKLEQIINENYLAVKNKHQEIDVFMGINDDNKY